MALGPISNVPAALPAPSSARDVTNAQRAFFQAALAEAAPMAAMEAPASQPSPAPEPARTAPATDAPKTGYKPGSLLDIRI
jgi:hypothetical protein